MRYRANNGTYLSDIFSPFVLHFLTFLLQFNHMSENIDTLTANLSSFGISEEESLVYLAILRRAGDTALTIARHLKLKRTTVYRILDSLIDKKLVITKLGNRGSRFVATPIDQLDFLIADREHEIDKLKKTLPGLKQDLNSLIGSSPENSQVLYYHGIEGIKQITYNSLKAKGELLTYELGTMDSFMSHDEAEKLRERFVDNNIRIRTFTNMTEMEGWTDIGEMVEHWQVRHLPPQKNPFQFEILIYNDVFCMYKYTKGEAFAVEIYNQELADMQRQLFEYLWSNARELKILDEHGSAKLA